MGSGPRAWESEVLTRGPVAVLGVAADGRILNATPRAVWALTGRTESVIGEELAALVHPSEAIRISAWLAEVAATRAGQVIHIDLQVEGSRPRFVELQGMSLLEDPQVEALVVAVAETTRFQEQLSELHQRAFVDPLTGLANRSALLARLEEALRTRADTSVIYLDLDGFKAVNDRHGHAAGDAVLQRVAALLDRSAPRNATASRIGGDEFVILLPGTDEDQGLAIAQSVVSEVQGLSHHVDGRPVRLSASAGVASHRSSGGDALGVMRRADAAMYQAKATRRGGASTYDPAGPLAASDLVSQLQAENARLVQLASTDELTGIGNLRHYRERLGATEQSARTLGRSYSLLFCDLDSFKTINKAFGQSVGDAVLREVVMAISQRLRPGDEVHRRGGEELVVILPKTSADSAREVGERLREAVEDLALPRSEQAGDIVTISIGVAAFDPDDPRDSQAVEATADLAMRAAKDQGKNRVVVLPAG